MAKRATSEQEAYNPVGEALAKEVMAHSRENRSVRPIREEPPASAKIVPHPRAASSPPADGSASPANVSERLSMNPPLRTLIPADERDDFDALVTSLAKRLGSRLKGSHVLRACIRCLLRAEEHLLRRSDKMGKLFRPANNNPLAMAKFEDDLTDLIDAAFHDTVPRRTATRFERSQT
jgi:hypothetical protein